MSVSCVHSTRRVWGAGMYKACHQARARELILLRRRAARARSRSQSADIHPKLYDAQERFERDVAGQPGLARRDKERCGSSVGRVQQENRGVLLYRQLLSFGVVFARQRVAARRELSSTLQPCATTSSGDCLPRLRNQNAARVPSLMYDRGQLTKQQFARSDRSARRSVSSCVSAERSFCCSGALRSKVLDASSARCKIKTRADFAERVNGAPRCSAARSGCV